MKKTKKVISYIMLLVPLALPAGCSTVSGSGGSQSGVDRRTGADDESEQLRLIVERYFEQEERQRQMLSQLNAATPSLPVPDVGAEEEEPGPTFAESLEELQEELAALAKTGAWTAENLDMSQSVQEAQCQLPPGAAAQALETAVMEAPDRPDPPLVSGSLPQPAETAAAPLPELTKPAAKRAACDFPVLVNRQVQFYLDLYKGKQRKHFSRWLERSSQYLPFITAELEKAGLPVELTWLAMIESGFDSSAYSPSHASGIWQFIPSTGRNFGLRVDSLVDERRDPEKSTKAAAAYLKALHRQFGGDWHLAVAAYNAGEGAVMRGLRRSGAKNFWELASHDYLKLETKRYVPQLIAAVLIARNPAQHGFRPVSSKNPPRHELVRVPAGVNLKTVAVSGSMSVEQLRKLNNELLTDQVPADAKGGWLLKVPSGRSALVAANLPKAQAVAVAAVRPAESSAADYLSHKVAKNETLSQISAKYDVSMTSLLKVNSLRSAELKAGQSLRIPAAAAAQPPVLMAAAAPAPKAAAEKITHKLNKGETLSDIGKKYNVSVAEIMKWNKIAHAGKVKSGQKLAIQLPEAAAVKVQTVLAAAPAQAPEGAIELTAASMKRKPGAESAASASEAKSSGLVVLSSSGKRKAESAELPVTYYKVRSGDSLWSISKKLEVSAGDLKNWNRLDGGQLQPGTTLVIRNG